MLDINTIITNEKLENEGVWCPFPQGAEMRIARVGNDRYKSLLRKKWKASKAALEQEDDFAANLSEEMMIEVYAATVLLDVKGISMDGQEITKYTVEVGRKLLKHREIRERVKAYAEDAANYRDKVEEDIEKS